jgi:phosphonate transport system substrate-binding protein
MNMGKKWKKRLFQLVTVVLLLITTALLSGCVTEETNKGEIETETTTVAITMGTVGDDVKKYEVRYQPVIDYLAEKLRNETVTFTGKVVVANTIDNMTILLKEQKIDLYVDNPTYVARVLDGSGCVPFLRRWKEGLAEYHSVFFVKNDSDIISFDDFVGKTIGFEDDGSTSGYLMPRAYLESLGYNLSTEPSPDTIQYNFTLEDFNTALWVSEGKLDIGAFSQEDWGEVPENITNKLRIVGQTYDIPRHLVAHRSGLDSPLVARIRQILIDMDEDPEGKVILEDFKETTKFDEIPDMEGVIARIKSMLEIIE